MAWLIRRLAGVALSAYLALTAVFFLSFLAPGDPAVASLSQSGASAEVIAQRRSELGLDRSPTQQYVSYLSGVARGNLGTSWASGQSVTILITRQVRPTLALALASIAVAAVLGVVGGLGAAAESWVASIASLLAISSLAIPVMFTGTLVIWLVSIQAGIFPATGQGGLHYLVLPASVLGFNVAGAIARVTYESIQQTMGAPFVLAARARGLPKIRVQLRHVFRAAMLPVVDIIALQFGYLLGGVAIVESVFSRQGLGRVLVAAVLDKDMPVILGLVLVSALVFGLLNLAVDVMRVWLDPRLRIDHAW